MSNLEKGRLGEERTERYLIDREYRILERNFRFQHREVDIIALKGDTLVFVEVKARGHHGLARGFESITERQKKNIISVARYYVEKKGFQDYNVRFDVASIDGRDFDYIEGAFGACGACGA
jgi:putative endonuclease